MCPKFEKNLEQSHVVATRARDRQRPNKDVAEWPAANTAGLLSKREMAKIRIVHPGPNNLRRGITPVISRQLLEATTDALKNDPGEYTLSLATHGAQLARNAPGSAWGRIVICEAIFMKYATLIQDMEIMTPEEAVEHWRITIEAPATYIKQANEERDETTQNATGQATLFPL
jgi:hypothetical protein